TSLVVLAGFQINASQLTLRRAVLFAALGVIAVWLSHPSVFVLAGVGTTLALGALKRKDWQRFWKLTGIFTLWVLSFALCYTMSLKHLTANRGLESSWMNQGTFMPLPPASLADVGWSFRAFFNMFSNPADLPFSIVAGLLFLIGCIALLREQKTRLLMLIS